MIHPPFRDSKNPFLRKGAAVAFRSARPLAGLRDRGSATSPILVNSVPKSGTHLLSQVIDAFPGHASWGEFLVSTPSLTMREVSTARMHRRLGSLIPGEIAKGHLFWDESHERWIDQRRIASFFIYRDLRDLVVSEAHYLTDMNRWHRMHREFRALSESERIMLAIKGDARLCERGIYYPDIGVRFARYEPWLRSPGTYALRYEDLVGANRADTVDGIVKHYAGVSATDVAQGDLVLACQQAIAPSRSHTFRVGGGAGSWQRSFSPDHREAFKKVAGETLINLGYEMDMDW